MSLYQLIPYKRVAEHFNNNTDSNISQGSLCSFNEEAYYLLESFNKWVIAQQCQAKVLNADETGINIKVYRFNYMLKMIRDAGHIIEFLPPYSPDLNNIEHKWFEKKAYIKKYNCSVEQYYS